MTKPVPILLAVAVVLAGCQSAAQSPLEVEELPAVAQAPSGQPHLTATPGGTVFLSWIERPQHGKLSVLRLARLDGDRWEQLSDVASGDDWFVNWADTPSVTALSDSVLFAHFLKKSGPDTYAYHVMVTQSTDGGQTWSTAQRLHSDSSDTEHGFVSLIGRDDDSVVAIWLDGRETAGGHGHGSGAGAMTLRSASVRADGSIGQRRLIDERVCDCCQTAAASLGSEIVAVYRDRSSEEIRDVYAVRLGDDGWTTPTAVHDDGWEIAGCPVNGPAISADPVGLGVAWFTAAEGKPAVRAAFSRDGGASFGDPIRIDDGKPLGRAGIVADGAGAFAVTWLEDDGERASVRLRFIDRTGTEMASTVVAHTGNGRASGFPRIAASGDNVYLAWTDTEGGDEPPVVRTARVAIP